MVQGAWCMVCSVRQPYQDLITNGQASVHVLRVVDANDVDTIHHIGLFMRSVNAETHVR
jgi:hypothetical protein